jgi:hypothetical protein
MSSRIARTCLLVACLAWSSTAGAAWYYNPLTGKLYWKSVECAWNLSVVPQPSTHPAFTQCDVTVQSVLVFCLNPNNHNVSPGEAATQDALFSGTAPLTDGNIVKKGGAHTTVEVPVDLSEFTLTSQYCVNPNWQPVQAVANDIVADMKTYKCLVDLDATGRCPYPDGADTTLPNPNAVLCSGAVLQCSLPPKTRFPVEGTQYQCTEVSVANAGCPVN